MLTRSLSTLALVLVTSSGFAAEEPSPDTIRAAIRRAIPPMEAGIRGHSGQRDCFSCHHHAMGTIVATLGKDRGFEFDAAEVAESLDLAEAQLKRGAEVLKQGKPIGGGVTTVGYSLMTLDLGKRPANETTAAAIAFLLKSPANGDHWRASSNRVPSEGSDFTSTYVAIRGLKAYAPASEREKSEKLIAGAKKWLLDHPGRETEDRVFRLRGLHAAGATPEELKIAAETLVKAQRADGGWAQLDEGMESDAYATGTVLVALAQAGGIGTDDPAYRKGIAFLLKTQKPDGTWYVKSRTKVIVQKYFETGFPHGKDQFISIAATGWSTAALMLALPVEPKS